MLSYIKLNPLIMIFVIGIIVLVLLYFYLKSLSTKTKKKEVKQESKVETKEATQDSTEQVEEKEENNEDSLEKQEEIDSVVGKGGKKSRVTRIYKRDIQKSNEPIEETKNIEQSDLDAEFVDVSKNVSRFKTLREEDFVSSQEESVIDEYGFVAEQQEDCVFCEDNVKHFDHSRRLSKFIKEENFDGMFASHLSSYADRIEKIDKHLNITDDSLAKLYDKANKTIENSKNKIISEVVKDSIMDSIEEHNENVITHEELRSKLDLKTMLIADTVMNRKKKK